MKSTRSLRAGFPSSLEIQSIQPLGVSSPRVNSSVMHETMRLILSFVASISTTFFEPNVAHASSRLRPTSSAIKLSEIFLLS